VVVENHLWEAFVGIAAGKDIDLTLTHIAADAHIISQYVESEAARRGWFIEGTQSVEHLCLCTYCLILSVPIKVSSLTSSAPRDSEAGPSGVPVPPLHDGSEDKGMDGADELHGEKVEDKGKDKGKGKGKSKGKGRKGKGKGGKGKGKDMAQFSDSTGNNDRRRRLPQRTSKDKTKQPQREFDLPIVAVLPAPRQLMPHVKTVLDDSPTEGGVEVTLFRALPGTEPICYEYKGWERSVSSPF